MQKNYGIKFAGIGTSLPSKVVTNTELQKLFDTSDEWIYTRTGIKERRIISNGESGLSLSLEASEKALQMAKLAPDDLDLIIVCTSTPDRLYPSTGCLLQGKLNAKKAVSFDISAACSGFIYGIVVASQFIYTGQYKNILLVGVDVHSRFIDWSSRSVAVLFGDGAGAVVLKSCLAKDDELLYSLMHSEADSNLDLTLGNDNVSFSDFTNPKCPNFVKMNGKAIYQFAIKVVPQITNKLLDMAYLKSSQVDYFIPHQANQRIIEAAATRVGFLPNQIISNIEKVGNTSAASIPLAIADGLQSGVIKTPCKMILVGFGAGLTWGGAIIDWHCKL